MTKILIVDDEEILVKGLKRSLESEGFETDAAYNGIQALEKSLNTHYDLMILDLMLPEVDGLEVCRRIRQVSQMPIIMVTAKGDDVEKIIGLELGADDYLAKPFNTRELLARIKAVLRRSSVTNSDNLLSRANARLKLNLSRRTVSVNHIEITTLTAKEFDMLLLLAKHPGKVYTREDLIRLVWGYDYTGEDRTVDVHIRRLRDKIEPDPSHPEFIQTKWGIGYFFQPENVR
ncbi:response regulator transcription factor [Dehalobacter sp. DCM]|uniref:response regulator transcription factor n=1 Tax=Dehalobacter sp. DCM TaxID=2907827 RepID=UPI0030816440|nr:response regulator transcription factor [Dehalobacter sp. DCM]